MERTHLSNDSTGKIKHLWICLIPFEMIPSKKDKGKSVKGGYRSCQKGHLQPEN